MGKVQAYPSDEVCEKINAIVEKRRMEGAKDKDVSFSRALLNKSNFC